MLCKCHWIVLYTVHFTAFCLGGAFFPGHGVYCGYTVRHRANVTIDSLQEVACEKSIGTKMNDLDLCLEVVLRSCQPLRQIRH